MNYTTYLEFEIYEEKEEESQNLESLKNLLDHQTPTAPFSLPKNQEIIIEKIIPYVLPLNFSQKIDTSPLLIARICVLYGMRGIFNC